VNKLRVSLVEKAGVIRGKIETDSDALFVLECLAVIVGEIAMKSGVPNLRKAG